MDKYEYKIRSEEIKSLIAKGEYADAASIADTIDWRRVKSVMMLCTISDLYKINRRFEDAKDMLLMAYDKYPGGRSIVYSLCELSIKMEEFVQAVEYYKEFVQIAPKDSGRYILQYKLYEAQDVSLEERIAVLEELKAKDYSERWAYELAYLYHRIGLATKCVEECDELILWFGEGKYVIKAMELKMLHESLNEKQQEKYNEIKGIKQADHTYYDNEDQAVGSPVEPDLIDAPTKEIPQQELDIQVKLMNVGQYDTINMQKELAQNMKELWEGPSVEEQSLEEVHKTENYDTEAAAEVTSADQAFDEAEPVVTQLAETKVEEVFFSETGEIDQTASQVMEAIKNETVGGSSELTATPAGDMKEWSIGEPPEQFKKILGMDYDGQISMVMPESEQVEKQITGQISLQDVLIEWEKMKKDSEQKRMEAVRQRVMQQTGAMFTEFEAATRDGLLEQLEKTNNKGNSEQEEANVSSELSEETDFIEDTEDTPDMDGVEELEEIEDTEDVEVTEENIVSDTEDEFDETEDTEELSNTEEPEDLDEFEDTEDLEDAEEQDNTDEYADAEQSEDTEEFEDTEESEDTVGLEDTEDSELSDESENTQETDDFAIAEDIEEVKDAEDIVVDEDTDDIEDVKDIGETEESDTTEEISDAEEIQDTKEDKSKEDAVKTMKHDKAKGRTLSPEEKQLYGTYALNKNTREQIIHAVDNISMASYTGNVIITGEEEADGFNLAKRLLKEVQMSDGNFSGTIAKITPQGLQKKGVEEAFAKLANGALIIEKAGSLDDETIGQMKTALEQESRGLVVVLVDTRQAMHKLVRNHEILSECFNIEVNIEALDDAALVAYAQKYAKEQEYSIDELGILALHTRIAERQTSDHSVTITEVKEIMNEAIHHANRKTLGHFFDILVAKRYDGEDMIILREKDFI